MKLTIYHTNDIHADIEFLKKVQCYLKKNKSENDLYFDSGDFADLKSSLFQCDKGYSAFELMKYVGLDAMTLGNGEIDLSYDAITKISTLVPIIGTSVTDNNDNKIPNVLSSLIINKYNKRFLIIGISPYYSHELKDSGYNVFSMMGNVKFHEPKDLVRKQLDLNKGKYDYCILLSHSGEKVDNYLLPNWPEIDLVLGGHHHNVVTKKGYSESGKGECLGKIVLEINDNEIKEVESTQIYLDEMIDPEFDNLCKEKEIYAEKLLSKPMDYIRDLKLDYFNESELINFIADALLKKMGGDLAFINAGIVESDLKYPVSKMSLLKLSPSKLNPTKFQITGSQLLSAIKISFDDKYISQDGKGPGFRGHILGTLGYSHNVKIYKNTLEVFIDNKPLDMNKKYTVVSNDYLQRGTYYTSLKTPNEESEFHIWFIRDLIENYLMDKELFESYKVKRIYE